MPPTPPPSSPERWKARYAAFVEAVPALMLAAMFLCFIIQVVMRYVLRAPVGWTVEVCVIAWLWILLWGQSVSAREEDEIRFDLVYSAVRPATRRLFRILFSLFVIGIYAVSLPALWDFVTFMRIEKTTYLDIRFNWVYAIALVFVVVSILRYGWILWGAIRGRDAETKDTAA